MKFILLIFYIFICCYNISFSQNNIITKDTTIQSNIVYKYSIYGKITENNHNIKEICFSYNTDLINIFKINLNENTLIKKIISDTIIFDGNKTTFIIRFNDYEAEKDGILLDLDIFGNSEVDTNTSFEITCFNSDNKPLQFTQNIGKIKILSNNVSKEVFGLFFPNPFDKETNLHFNIIENTKLSFFMYSINGVEVLNNNSEFVQITNESGTDILYSFDYIFSKGVYKLRINFENTYISAGPYFIIIKTDKNIYKYNLIYLK